jgi:hypothetical protein
MSISHSSAHVNFLQQTDRDSLRGVSRQAVLGIAATDRCFGKPEFQLSEVRITEVLLYHMNEGMLHYVHFDSSSHTQLLEEFITHIAQIGTLYIVYAFMSLEITLATE